MPWLLNGICPYFTMFPLQYPVNILNNTQKDTIVLDPFCGRGTSIFAARMFGYNAYGIDNNPVAVAISKSKLSAATVEMIMETLNKALDYTGNYDIPQSEFWQWAFEMTVLEQLCKIRAYLHQHDGMTENALRGIILGALHGPKAKQMENNSYLSNQMPRTFSSKPSYSISYWKKHNIKPDKISIAAVVKKRAQRYYNDVIPEVNSNIINGDSRENASYRQLPPMTLIITSPPYYGMRTYYIDQWLRNWFLGGPDVPVNILNNQMDHSSPDDFARNLGMVWKNCARFTTPDARMYVRFGSIPSRKTSARDIFEKSIALSENAWRIIAVSDAGNSSCGKRQAAQMLVGQKRKSEPINEIDVELIKNA
ncbi:MAG: site-specific DNA-methyltransferase [Treponema sp.]|jgi:DNA modification methylase|nr:site-specific DNA-methyltransferase [Treponema sp.]